MTPMHVVPDPVTIPLDIDRVKVITHARRVAHLTTAWSRAVVGLREHGMAAMAAIMPIGIALSQAIDLDRVGTLEAGRLTTDEVRAAAFPASPKTRRFREAIAADAPRYEPPDRFQRVCPVGGPRGGRCPGPLRHTRWVTDTSTGAWEWREVCEAHQDIVRQRANTSPDPAPNRGGVLAEVFPDVDMDVIYAWARPGWTPAGDPEGGVDVVDVVASRGAFRLIVGGGA
jgi:hypothetical protein